MTTSGSSIASLMADAAESMRRGQSAAAVPHWQQGDHAIAREYLQHAANADPGLAIVQANLARLHIRERNAYPLEREMVVRTIEGMTAFYGERTDLEEL